MVVVLVESYNDGGGRAIRVSGPGGTDAMVPTVAEGRNERMIAWALEQVEVELRKACNEIDKQVEPGGVANAWRCEICRTWNHEKSTRCYACGSERGNV